MLKKISTITKSQKIILAVMVLAIAFTAVTAGLASVPTSHSAYEMCYGDNRAEVLTAKAYIACQSVMAKIQCHDMTPEEIHYFIQRELSRYSYDDSHVDSNIYDGITHHKMVCRGYAAYARDLWDACGYNAETVIGYRTDDVDDPDADTIRQHAWVRVALDDGTEINLDYTLSNEKYSDDTYLSKAYTEVCTFNENKSHNNLENQIYKKLDNSGFFQKAER